ncbi:MAG: methyltransferase [Candidatus Tokpelaia sp. JSC161]|jgi:SAM-dependent MidA family methyltransferase|nr:MAG: methyltransferase [Candidatus Tokpelaia sp. JSC161]
MVSLDHNGRLCISSSPLSSLPLEIKSLKKIKEGHIIELSPARLQLTKNISDHIFKNSGAALIIDYGEIEGSGDTFQAMSKHQFCDPLKNPGTSDLTSHVDFSTLIKSAHQAGCYAAILTQGEFLIKNGLIQRADKLCEKKSKAFRKKTIDEIERLAAPNQMGQLFKTLCISNPHSTMFPFFY